MNTLNHLLQVGTRRRTSNEEGREVFFWFFFRQWPALFAEKEFGAKTCTNQENQSLRRKIFVTCVPYFVMGFGSPDRFECQQKGKFTNSLESFASVGKHAI